MILNLEDGVYLDVDKISLLSVPNQSILIEGLLLTDLGHAQVKEIEKAYVYAHKSHMYDKSLKKIRWIKGEK
jgi:hypothetical protein